MMFRRPLPASLVALLLALTMCAANLLEPVTADDVCHHYYAAQVAADPLHPYEFVAPWHQKPVPAWTIMVAPVHSYYWAPAIAWFGDSVIAWHLWFLPVQWLFCFGLLHLLRRWLRRGVAPVAVAIALGPAVLPGLNLMLEVPMLSLGLASLGLLLRSFDRRAIAPALFAGVLFGLALQTKYSALAFFGPWLLWTGLRGRWREGLVGLTAAAATALGIEGLLSWSHGGGSFFLQQLSYSQVRDWSHLVKGMVQNVGLLAAPATLLALAGFGARPVVLVGAAATYVVGLGLVGWFPDDGGRGLADGAIDSLAYAGMSALTWGVLGWLLLCLVRSGLAGRQGMRCYGSRALRVFLVAWCLAEIAASFAVSPFPAARRALMVVVALTVTAGYWCARRRRAGGAMRWVAVGAALFGLFVQAVDYVEGHCWVAASHGAVRWAKEQHPGADVYFTGGWGFEFYAPRAGMKPLLAGEVQLRRGDLVMAGSIDGVEGVWFEPDPRLEQIAALDYGVDRLPWSTQFAYYSGQRPLVGQAGPRFRVFVLRANADLHTRELRVIPDKWKSRGEQ
ncbi:MAG TPA: hypothetical protein ENI87_05790 [bacterium]|nr:hypothetical protein [bacterium]